MTPRACLATLLAAVSGLAWGAFFNFDDLTPGPASEFVVENEGVQVTITSLGYVYGYDYFIGQEGGSRGVVGSLTETLQTGLFLPLTFTFSVDLSAVSFQTGDIGGDDDGNGVLVAYDEKGLELGVYTIPLGDGEPVVTVDFHRVGIRSFTWTTTSVENPNSVLVDNLRVSPVPEPATFLALGLGVFALRRRRHNIQ